MKAEMLSCQGVTFSSQTKSWLCTFYSADEVDEGKQIWAICILFRSQKLLLLKILSGNTTFAVQYDAPVGGATDKPSLRFILNACTRNLTQSN